MRLLWWQQLDRFQPRQSAVLPLDNFAQVDDATVNSTHRSKPLVSHARVCGQETRLLALQLELQCRNARQCSRVAMQHVQQQAEDQVLRRPCNQFVDLARPELGA